MRIPIIAGNWKMFKDRDEALKFIYVVTDRLPLKDKVESVICAPSVFLRSLVKRQGEQLRIGAQNMHFADQGAYTGEISADMLKSINVEYVIIGHSERRAMFNETDESVNKKLHQAFKNDLNPILCVGESLEVRESGKTEELVGRQVELALEGLEKTKVSKLIIAYEPIWAIGTGKTATSEQAEEMCKFIRNKVRNLYDEKTADKMRIQYGGSVKLSNIDELMNMPNIDGALIGGASLNPEDFIKLVEAALK
ncbi:MAG: triose-phosphate isomerase [Bacilli bacterium]|jgi:triosephosphate isomerase|nr:triose-phosphate isomerase [Bacilli bacterium]MDD2681327.1 triose-phosphate isomerase [Bacilli bacterium]MDD3120836.1 triose-phosphate isomerase [Bacilli bacterium]MDD4063031.1 triose-phosphate isomerase [Bacilli bacterium]MDD4481689.1 triose-phosphate isomerase [Bacilli bacterium]